MVAELLRVLSRVLVALSFVAVGVAHFRSPSVFVAIMPPVLPWPHELVLISGFFEVLGGVGLLVPPLRRAAAWGLLALLIAVYPANIHMLVNDVYLPGMAEERWLLWVRMPLQLVIAAGVVWAGGLWPRVRAQSPSRASARRADDGSDTIQTFTGG